MASHGAKNAFSFWSHLHTNTILSCWMIRKKKERQQRVEDFTLGDAYLLSFDNSLFFFGGEFINFTMLYLFVYAVASCYMTGANFKLISSQSTARPVSRQRPPPQPTFVLVFAEILLVRIRTKKKFYFWLLCIKIQIHCSNEQNLQQFFFIPLNCDFYSGLNLSKNMCTQQNKKKLDKKNCWASVSFFCGNFKAIFYSADC